MSELVSDWPARGLWTWAELRCFASALGYPRKLFVECIPPDVVRVTSGISTEDLHKLLQESCFDTAMDLTCLLKSNQYNILVIKKCIQLLDCRILSFSEIRNVRLAFSAYEHLDQCGMEIDQHTLMRALKMCSRLISPEKMMHRVKHWKETYDRHNRIQLFEFLDLLTITEAAENVSIKEEKIGVTEKDSKNLYKLKDSKLLLETPDEKVMRHLNKQFYDEERNYGTVTTKSRKFTGYSILTSYRQQAAQLHQKRYQIMKKTLKACHEQVKLEKGSGLRQFVPSLLPCPKESRSAWSRGRGSTYNTLNLPTTKQREKQKHAVDKDQWVWVVPVIQLKTNIFVPEYKPPLISDEEIEAVQKKKEELVYDTNTLPDRTLLELNWKLDYYVPGYRKGAGSRRVIVTVEAPKKKTKSKQEPNVFERLTLPPKKRELSPCCPAKCGAAKPGKTVRKPKTPEVKVEETLNNSERKIQESILPESHTTVEIDSFDTLNLSRLFDDIHSSADTSLYSVRLSTFGDSQLLSENKISNVIKPLSTSA